MMSFTENWTPSKLGFSSDDVAAAKNLLERASFPTTRDEHWKYTRLTKISKTNFTQTAGNCESIDGLTVLNTNNRLVFVNGVYNAELSSRETIKGLTIAPISESGLCAEFNGQLPQNEEVFNAMNTLYATDGACIRIAKGAVIEQGVELMFLQVGEQTTAQVRNQIVVEEAAQAQVACSFQSLNAQDCFSNVVTQISVGKNAHFHIDKIQIENETSRHIATEQVAQDKDSNFTINTFTLNGLLTRNGLNIDVNGENCESNLNGIYLGKGKMHVDNHTVVDHKVPNCESNELYKGVMDDQSTAVFNGKVFVRKDAQKINAFQSNGNVLMTDSATVNSKPELEIYADDVKCSHGSTTGQLDENAIFYLRARGISEAAARKLMVKAFIGEVLEDKMKSEEVLTFIQGQLKTLFGWDFE